MTMPKTAMAPTGSVLTAAFAQVRIINLHRRADRRAETLAELDSLGESLGGQRCAFFTAIEPKEEAGFPSAGVRGCFLSHLAVLKAALREQADSVLVMEDDVAFVRKAPRLIAAAGRSLAIMEWDVAYLGHGLGRVGTPPGWRPVTGAMRYAHCYAVNGRILPQLVAFLERVLERQPGHPDGGPMHFDGALSTFLAQNSDVQGFYFSRNVAYQRPSRTDLHQPSLLDRKVPLLTLVRSVRWVKRRYLKLIR